MNREQLRKRCLSFSRNSNLLCELATGVGKTKIAIDCCNQYLKKTKNKSVCIFAQTKVQLSNIKKDIEKWGGIDCDSVDFYCYRSISKATKKYSFVIFDECHHMMTERVIGGLEKMKFKKAVFLSATVDPILKEYLRVNQKVRVVSFNLIDAIDNGILPKPTIILMPLNFDETKDAYYLVNGWKKTNPVIDDIKSIWIYRKNKVKASLRCSQEHCYKLMSEEIEYYRERYRQTGKAMDKTIIAKKSLDRLKWLSSIKEDFIKNLLKGLSDKRYIVFCSDVAQSMTMCEDAIHSKLKDPSVLIEKFNSKKIDHLSSCRMLDEGINLFDCEYACFNNIPASNVAQIQRFGRMLRHKEPKIIIPYYKNTREEEIVKEWMSGFNDEFKVINEC